MQESSEKSALLEAGERANVQKRHTMATISALNEAVNQAKLTALSNKPPEEVIKLQQEIAELVPVGNVAGLVLSGLVQLKGRVVAPERAQRDIEALLRGLDMLRKIAFGAAFFASPAAVLYAYQKMLTLTGKDVGSAFPNGLWQFYLEFSMREDAARHTNETNGFQTSLARFHMNLSVPDQLTAWVIAAINLYFDYDALLFTEWSEHIYLNLLEAEAELTKKHKDSLFRNLKKRWNQSKPYRRGEDAKSTETYTQYRRRKFQTFCQPRLQSLPETSRNKISQTYQARKEIEAPAFQKQLSILATLDPGRYRESRRDIPLWQIRVAVIWRQEYHLIPACSIDDQGNLLCYSLDNPTTAPVSLIVDKKGQLEHPQHGVVIAQNDGIIQTEKEDQVVGKLQPLSLTQLRHWIWGIIAGEYHSDLNIDGFETVLLNTERGEQPKARKNLSAAETTDLDLLKLAPIIINWDERKSEQPLAVARLGQRGLGDHALTMFRTKNSMIFDQSHIFFDGAWGLSLVEILTNEAVSWAAYLASIPPSRAAVIPVASTDYPMLQRVVEACAESNALDLDTIVDLRQNMDQRLRNISITVNDLLILYRSLFNREYIPSNLLKAQVNSLTTSHGKLVDDINQAWGKLPRVNPTLLIPINALNGEPKDRLYPVTFRNPFPEFLDLFYQTYNSFQARRNEDTTRSWSDFNHQRSKLIREIHYFGKLILMYKQLSFEGQNASLTTLKLLGHLPEPLQELLNKIPQKLDFLNEMLKGDEVFSNVGRVARGTSPIRFTSATDDNNAKTLVWGILTDDEGVLHISLRDFRPEVTALIEIGRSDLAQMMAEDFLNSFVARMNNFTHRLNEIAAETVEERI